MAADKKGRTVFLYVPNLLGYVRIALMIWSFLLFSSENPATPALLYALGQLLDAVDGTAARYLHQGI